MAAKAKKGKGLTPKKARSGGAGVTGIARARSNPGAAHRSVAGTKALTSAQQRDRSRAQSTQAQNRNRQLASNVKNTAKSRAPGAKGSTAGPSGSGSPTITKTVNTPAAPYLTAAQQQRENDTLARYAQETHDLGASVGVRNQATNTALQAASLAHARASDQANQLAAARGVFQSSIHDNDLNDLDAALVERQNMLNTALRTFTDQVNSHIALIQNTNIPQTQQEYNQIAVQNAANVTPSTTTQTVPNPNYRPPTTSTGSKSGSASKGTAVKMPNFNSPKVGPGRIPGGTRPTGNISYKPAAQPRLNTGFHFTNPLQGRPRVGRQSRPGGGSGGVRI